MPSRISKFSGYSLAALSAVLIFHAGSAMAGDPTSRAQSISVSVQDVLTGNHRFHAAPEVQTAAVDTAKRSASVQERIQEVLLGPSRLRVGITEATERTGGSRKLASIRAERPPSPGDTQAAVQRLLRGEHAPAVPVS